jgi:hypothetical protein
MAHAIKIDDLINPPEIITKGIYTAELNAIELDKGVYLVILKAGGKTDQQKMVVAK